MKYILGAGLAGLTCAYYTGYKVLTDKRIGGQLQAAFSLGPRYTHWSRETEKLLQELNISTETRNLNIAYGDIDTISNSPSKEFKKKYIALTRNGINKSYAMNKSESNSKVFITSQKKLVANLADAVKERIKKNGITKINLAKKTMTTITGSLISYDKLISTIPAPIFCKAANLDDSKLKANPITFAYVAGESTPFDFIYWVGKPYYRQSSVPEKEGTVFEFIGNLSDAKIQQALGTKPDMIQHLTWGKIISGSPPKADSVKYLGRYAEWDGSIKLGEVINECKNLRN